MLVSSVVFRPLSRTPPSSLIEPNPHAHFFFATVPYLKKTPILPAFHPALLLPVEDLMALNSLWTRHDGALFALKRRRHARFALPLEHCAS